HTCVNPPQTERAGLYPLHHPMELSIILVNWNSADFLVECLASIEQHTQVITYEIIIVDNASTKDEVDKIKQHFPAVTVIQSPDNLGFARANNLGFKRSTGQYVLF